MRMSVIFNLKCNKKKKDCNFLFTIFIIQFYISMISIINAIINAIFTENI